MQSTFGLQSNKGLGPKRACQMFNSKNHVFLQILAEGSMEAKFPTIWTDRNPQAGGRSVIEQVRREKMKLREKVGKSPNTAFFQCFVTPEGRKVGSLKRRARRHLGKWENKICMPLWARSTFWIEKCSKLSVSEHFWKLRYRKNARRCGANTFGSKMCQNASALEHI